MGIGRVDFLAIKYFLSLEDLKDIDDFVATVKSLDELKDKLRDFVGDLLRKKGAIY